MPKFPELTKAQREPLLALVRYQREEQSDQRFEVEYGYPHRIQPLIPDAPVVANAHLQLVELWHNLGYVANSHNKYGMDLILRQNALDYADYMSKRQVHRKVIDIWHDSRTELKAAILAFAVSVIVNVLARVFGW